MKFLASYVMRGQFQVLSVAVLLGLISLLFLPAAILCGAILALYVLRKGHEKAALIFLPTIALVYFGNQLIETRAGLGFPLVILLLIPVWISTLVLRATESQGLAITIAIGCAALFAISMHLYIDNTIQWWDEWLKTAITGVENANYQEFINSGSINNINGLVATILGLFTIASLFIGRWLQAKLYNPEKFSIEFSQLKIPKPVLFIIATILIVATALSRNLFNDLLMVFSIIYFLQGLAILHYLVLKKGLNRILLFPIYVIIFFLPHLGILGLAGAGVTDTFLNFRKLPE
jgi:hypothetical protein